MLKNDFFSIIKDKFNTDFRKNLLLMIGGTFLAQLIPILFSFLLTRIYSPEDFGVFSNFSAALSFLLVVMLFKFDMAIILPKKDSVAFNLLVLCLVVGVFFFILSTIIIYFLNDFICQTFNFKLNNNFLKYVPIAGLLFSVYSIINEWFVRKKQFKLLLQNKLINNSLVASTSAILPKLDQMSFGLIKGQIFGQFVAVVSGSFLIFKYDKNLFKFVDKRIIKKLFVKYINFAKFNIPGQFINALSVQIVVFYLTFQFGLKVVGLYALTDRFLGVPLSFIGNAVKDVFKQKAAEEYKIANECISVYKKTTLFLTLLALPPFIILFIFAPDLFSFLFGAEWVKAGSYAQVLSAMYLLSFITMPTGWLFVIAEKQRLDFLWQLLFLVFTIFALALSYIYLKKDIINTLAILSVARCISYIIQMFMTYQLAKGKK